jgi:hypothetical protein
VLKWDASPGEVFSGMMMNQRIPAPALARFIMWCLGNPNTLAARMWFERDR